MWLTMVVLVLVPVLVHSPLMSGGKREELLSRPRGRGPVPHHPEEGVYNGKGNVIALSPLFGVD